MTLNTQTHAPLSGLPFGMFAGFTQLGESIMNYVNYRRTLSQLQALPLDVLFDLGMDPVDLRATARKAVYGN